MSRFDRLFYSAAALCMVAGLALMSCAFSDAPWLPAAALAPSEAMAEESRAEVPPPEAIRASALDLAAPTASAEVGTPDRDAAPALPPADPLPTKASLPEAVARPAAPPAETSVAVPRSAVEAPAVRTPAGPSFRPHHAGRVRPSAPSVALLPSAGHGSAAKDAGVRAFSAKTAKDPLKALFGFARHFLEPGKTARVATAESAAEAR